MKLRAENLVKTYKKNVVKGISFEVNKKENCWFGVQMVRENHFVLHDCRFSKTK